METEHKIVAIETRIPDEYMSGLLLVRVHTDSGLVGHGETYYAPHAVAAMIHDWMARRLMGASALAIEAHWRFLYERTRAFGTGGTELRALSALDLALWDIMGQVCHQPIWQLLGGKVRDRIPVYNSCAGPLYGAKHGEGAGNQGWPGHGDLGRPGPLEDAWAAANTPGDLAEELLSQGYTGMKMWTLDRVAHKTKGLYIDAQDLKQAIAPFVAIRERVGMKMELILDGHGFFCLPAAVRIAEAFEETKLMWLEDVLHIDCVDTLVDFRRMVKTPVAASEMFNSGESFRLLLEKRGADYVMIDPTWVGGISQTVRIARMAEAYTIPVLMHDCTGPLTLLAGLQVAASVSNVLYQETVRAHIRTFYKDLIDDPIVVQSGSIAPPVRPGIGVRLNPDLFDSRSPGYRLSGKL
jgi:L-alanine-DL-glutamate epimerase-like enolase superfamily enzyme